MPMPASRFSHICIKWFVYLLFPNRLGNGHIIFITTYLANTYSREDEMFRGAYSLGHILPVTQ